MTDLRTLADAFEELERRGDAAEARMPEGLARRSVLRRTRLVPIGVAAAVVAGLAASVALLAPGDEPAGPAAAPSTTVSDPAPPSLAPSDGPADAPADGIEVPTTPEELADRFRTVLGDTATFEVTETGAPVEMTLPPAPGHETAEPPVVADPTPTGAAIVGTLTASGVTGGYDLQIYPGGGPAWCDDPTDCTVTQLDDGSTLAVGVHHFDEPAGGTTYQVTLVRPDGVTTLMHLSNLASPKGASETLAEQPPFTTDQMVEIVTSELW